MVPIYKNQTIYDGYSYIEQNNTINNYSLKNNGSLNNNYGISLYEAGSVRLRSLPA